MIISFSSRALLQIVIFQSEQLGITSILIQKCMPPFLYDGLVGNSYSTAGGCAIYNIFKRDFVLDARIGIMLGSFTVENYSLDIWMGCKIII